MLLSAISPQLAHAAPAQQSVVISVESKVIQTNETVEVLINASDLTGLNVTAFSFALIYDESLLSPLDVSIENTLSGPDAGNVTLIHNLDTPGRIAIAGASVSPLAGEGALVRITFQSQSTLGDATISFEYVTLNEGSPEASGTSGTLTISDKSYGDASLNGEVTAFDAAKVLQHAAQIELLNLEGLHVADVSASDGVSAYDASLILQHVSGLISCFPSEDGCAASKTAGFSPGALSWGAAKQKDQQVFLPVLVDPSVDGLYAIALEVSLDQGDINTVDVQYHVPQGWIMQHHATESGILRVAMAGFTSLSSDTLVTLSSPVGAGNISATYQIHEGDRETLDSQTLTEAPETFALGPNFPNPFNPTTTIQYDVQEQVHVKLVVYDVIGREVQRLVDGVQQAGRYSIQFDAGNLSTGMYLCRIEAGTFTQTRQMTLVK